MPVERAGNTPPPRVERQQREVRQEAENDRAREAEREAQAAREAADRRANNNQEVDLQA